MGKKSFNAKTPGRGEGTSGTVLNRLAGILVDAAIEVHRYHDGPGLLESVCEEFLAEELKSRKVGVSCQQLVPVFYKGKQLASPLRLDMLVGGEVIVECKATEQFHSVFKSQLLTDLRAADKRLGPLVNFGEAQVSRGIHRIVNGL